MQQIADFHIHSRFSRACSRDLTLKNLDRVGRIKGVHIIGTGDFTHPEWFREIEEELVELPALTPSHAGGRLARKGVGGVGGEVDSRTGASGLYYHRDASDEKIKFTLTSEVALIYKDCAKPVSFRGVSMPSIDTKPRVRRIHLVVHGPNIAAVRELNNFLGQRFNLKSDGRPIMGISAPEFVKLCLAIHPEFLVYPAHIWTPWFSVFGSKSGFDSFEACFKEQTENIFAYETGLSSDPAMNWRVPALDGLTLLSNSDAHSPSNIGREANVLELGSPTYREIYSAIKMRDTRKLMGTIEFYPEEGMYHNDGHRECKVSFEPGEYEKHNGACPVCKKPLTIGVASRVAELAEREDGFRLPGAPRFEKLIELDKVIAEAVGVKSRNSVRVQKSYHELISQLGDELSILRTVDLDRIEAASDARIAEAVRRMRAGELTLKPGFDGQYGEVRIFGEEE